MKYQQKPISIEGILLGKLDNEKIKNEINKIKKLEEKIDRNNLKCRTNKYTYDCIIAVSNKKIF